MDEYTVKILPGGAMTGIFTDAGEAHRLARELAAAGTEASEAAEVLRMEDGGWKMSARYTPGQFDADGNFRELPVGP